MSPIRSICQTFLLLGVVHLSFLPSVAHAQGWECYAQALKELVSHPAIGSRPATADERAGDVAFLDYYESVSQKDWKEGLRLYRALLPSARFSYWPVAWRAETGNHYPQFEAGSRGQEIISRLPAIEGQLAQSVARALSNFESGQRPGALPVPSDPEFPEVILASSHLLSKQAVEEFNLLLAERGLSGKIMIMGEDKCSGGSMCNLCKSGWKGSGRRDWRGWVSFKPGPNHPLFHDLGVQLSGVVPVLTTLEHQAPRQVAEGLLNRIYPEGPPKKCWMLFRDR